MPRPEREMRYRYRLTFDVVVEGDGQHADGHGAAATARRLSAALAADARVLDVRASWPSYINLAAAEADT